jgi:lipid A 4'-phosphatase
MTVRACLLSPIDQNSPPSSTIGRRKRGGNIFRLFKSVIRYTAKTPPLWIPLLLLLSATIIFRFTDLDLWISRPFFVDHSWSLKTQSHWPLKFAEPWISLYEWGIYPAWILGLGGLLLVLASLLWKKIKPYRDTGLFLFLMLALGPGLLVNGIFKPYWGRPRPHETKPFGGTQEYLLIGERGNVSEGASFPSGHAAMGFYLMAPGFLFYRRRPRLAAAFFALGLASGTIMGAARIVAGSHFTSDVVWAAGMVYFTGLGLAAIFHFGKDETSSVR